MKKILLQLLSITLVILMIMAAVPLSAFAAPAAGISKEMLDNDFVDALQYTGYDVQAQKNDGTIFVKVGSAVPASIRSDISYGIGPSGLETVVDKSTSSGLAPDIEKFEKSGLCCASYVSYVYFNYLPNIAGIDTTYVKAPPNPRSAQSYYDTANDWVSGKKARKITFKQNSDGSGFKPNEEIPIGSLIAFKSTLSSQISHVAIYAGAYDGTHFITHVGDDKGPEFSSITALTKGDTPLLVALVVVPEYIERTGAIEVMKANPAGKNLSGAYFSATSVKDGIQYLIGPTNKNGYAITQEGLPFGDYIVKETVYPSGYTDNGTKEWRVTVNGDTPKVKLKVINDYKYGSVKVTKAAEDGYIKNVVFKLVGTDFYGNKVNLTASTGNTGIAVFNKVPMGKNYELTELNVPSIYVLPDVQNVAVEWNKVTQTTVNNKLKKWSVKVYKKDREGEVQGNATLSGAVYGLFKNGELVDSYTTDKNGYFLTDWYNFETDSRWYIQEITPSEGYLLDSTVYELDVSPEDYTKELNTLSTECFEDVIKGQITIAKHWGSKGEDISTNPPEAGAEFQVFLKSAGSYDNAKQQERDYLITDEYGFAKTKELPFGTYTIVQTKGKEGTEIMKPFVVSIKKDKKEYGFIVNNALLESFIEIVKVDSETGKNIPVAGIGFKVKNRMTGEFISQHINYPTPKDIDVFYTNENGMLMLPEKLPYGQYEIIEECSAEGYVLDKNPVLFVVDGSKETVRVVLKNKVQKGKIKVSKTGEIFSSVSKYEGMYQPFYTVEFLEGAVFRIAAAEDITTPDGTLRYKKGEVVDQITTSKDGKSESIPLYIGKYTVTEVEAPNGMVLNSEPKTVELTYAGQETEITEVKCSFFNERQKLKINLIKELEKGYGLGEKEIKNMYFALFADEEIRANDGTFIPRDALIEIKQCKSDGSITFKTDLPVGSKVYVREYSTDKHYIISDIVYPIEFQYAGQDTKEVTVSLNEGKPIVNKLIKGTITGTKTNKDGNPLMGVVFGLFSSDEKEFTEKNALEICVSDINGGFFFANVPYGTWLIKELYTVDGYTLNDKAFIVNVKSDDGETRITVVNEEIGVVNTDVDEVPKTGDNRKLWIPIALMLLSGVTVVGVLAKNRKRKEN